MSARTRKAARAKEVEELAVMIGERIAQGTPRPLTPEALLHEHLAMFTPALGLDQYSTAKHRRLARDVFARLVVIGVARPVAER